MSHHTYSILYFVIFHLCDLCSKNVYQSNIYYFIIIRISYTYLCIIKNVKISVPYRKTYKQNIQLQSAYIEKHILYCSVYQYNVSSVTCVYVIMSYQFVRNLFLFVYFHHFIIYYILFLFLFFFFMNLYMYLCINTYIYTIHIKIYEIIFALLLLLRQLTAHFPCNKWQLTDIAYCVVLCYIHFTFNMYNMYIVHLHTHFNIHIHIYIYLNIPKHTTPPGIEED